MKDDYNYYRSQLEKLNSKSVAPKKLNEYPLSVVFYDDKGNKTNYMDINLESIPEIIKFLKAKEKELKSLS